MTVHEDHNFTTKKMLDIFCNVIDNFGDIGFSLRLARDLTIYNLSVCLYCNNIQAVKKIASNSDLLNPRLAINPWPESASSYTPSDTVIEAFSCRLPNEISKKIKSNKSLVIQLDYLTAEKFAEDCHGLSSSSDGTKSFFFFPGFTKKTGGIICEDAYKKKIQTIKQTSIEDPCNISIFCYKTANLEAILNWLSDSKKSFSFSVFEGQPWQLVSSIFGRNHQSKDTIQSGNFSFKYTTMSDQIAYDSTLLSHNLNFVRGEDSIVRAMLSGRPFLWNIYPQEADTHIKKLNSFFEFAKTICGSELAEPVRELNLIYNGHGKSFSLDVPDKFFEIWSSMSLSLSKYMLSQTSLTDRLISFISEHKI